MQTPFMGFSPELLAQIAQGAFRPPQPMMGMQAPAMQPQQQGGGMGIGEGIAGLGAGMPYIMDFLTGYKGDPMASASYGSARPAMPAAAPGYGHGYGVRGGV